jgi:3-phosphoshikimate 1-carboxyvinyltransferase
VATQAKGQTIIKNAEELKVKETNRIDAIATQLGRLGAVITPTEDGLIIEGEQSLRGGKADSLTDHRIGMTLSIASLLTDGPVELENEDAISVSYPSFFEDLDRLLS